MTLCACGCGEEARPGRRYIKGHWQRMKGRNKYKLQSSDVGKRKADELIDTGKTTGAAAGRTSDERESMDKPHCSLSASSDFVEVIIPRWRAARRPNSERSRPITVTECSGAISQKSDNPINTTTINPACTPDTSDPRDERIRQLEYRQNLLSVGIFVSIMLNVYLIYLQGVLK